MAVTAIIGHGRSAEGRKWGPRIDRCNMVVRMWDWHWQSADDYGSRYDVGLFEISNGLIDRFRQYNRRRPARCWIASFLWRLSREYAPPGRVEIVDQRRWTEIGVQQFGGAGTRDKLQFTRGTIAACWAIEAAAVGDTVMLIGFDNVLAAKALPIEEGFSKVYRAEPSTFHFDGYAEGETRYGNHDFTVELPVMRFLAAHRGINLVFAQQEWA